MPKSFSDRHITQRYMRRYGETARTRAWAGRRVQIRTENGVWRENARGYTTAGSPEAWILPFEEAVKQIDHCGPEKRGSFILAPDEPDIVIARRKQAT